MNTPANEDQVKLGLAIAMNLPDNSEIIEVRPLKYAVKVRSTGPNHSTEFWRTVEFSQ